MILQQKKYGIPDMFLLAFRTSPFYTIIWGSREIFNALIPTFTIFITADFIDKAIAVFNREAPLSAVYLPVSLLVAIMLFNTLQDAALNIVHHKLLFYCRTRLTPEFIGKMARLEYRHIENPETADMINRVCPTGNLYVWAAYPWYLYQSGVLGVISQVVYIAGIMTALFSQVWWLGLSMLVAGAPIMIVSTIAGRQSYDAYREMSKVDRRAGYLSDVMKSREAVEERSVYQFTPHLDKEYTAKFEYVRKYRLNVERKNLIRSNVSGIMSSAYSIGAMLAMLMPVMDGDMTVGMFIALIGAVFGLSERMSWGVGWLFNHFVTAWNI